MIIKEYLLDCTLIKKELKSGIFRGSGKLVEHRNAHNAPYFEFEGTAFYVETMEVEYKTNEYHIMRAELITMQGYDNGNKELGHELNDRLEKMLDVILLTETVLENLK
ncbi:hypothetical protein [Enterococcus phage vB_Efa_ZAT1]